MLCVVVLVSNSDWAGIDGGRFLARMVSHGTIRSHRERMHTGEGDAGSRMNE